MEYFERKSVKLLAHCGKQVQDIIGECLCDQPDPKLVRLMLTELRKGLDEFEDAYFED